MIPNPWTRTNPGIGSITTSCRKEGGCGIKVLVNITAISGGTTLVVAIATINPPDAATGNQPAAALTSAALSATGCTELTIYPGVTVAANVAVSQAMGSDFAVKETVAVANSITYTITPIAIT